MQNPSTPDDSGGGVKEALFGTDYKLGETSDAFLGGFFDRLDILFHPNEVLDALAGVPLVAASVIVTVGVLCILNGYRWHKWVIAILAFMIGLGIGYRLSRELGRSTVVAASVGCLCALIATPLLRITVAIFGGLTGAFIGANTWTAFDTTPAGAPWAGAAIGFILVAMTSLILFRLVIVLFTSVGGAVMVVFGVITLLMHVPSLENTVRESLLSHDMMIPLLLLLAAVSGFVIQESRLRGEGISILATEEKTTSDE